MTDETPPPSTSPTPEQRATSRAQLFAELQPVGFAVAYRMLGRVRDAEDLVQEAFLRLHHRLEDGELIESPQAYLTTVVTRLCIDHLRSARSRGGGEVEVVPEPLVTVPGDTEDTGGTGDTEETGDGEEAEAADSLSLTFLVVLRSLPPEQRAAFVLHDVFDHPYDQIAAVVAISEESARQLVARARRHVERDRPRFEPSPERREGVARRFFAAAQDGEIDALEELLADDVVLHGALRARAPVEARPLKGRVAVGRTLLAWVRATTRFGGLSLREVVVNGQPGALVLDPSDRLLGVLALDIAEGGRIQAITSIVDPAELTGVGLRLGPLDRRSG